MRTYLADELPQNLTVPVRFNVFGVRPIPKGKGKRTRTELVACGWQGWNPDPQMEDSMARLKGSGSFYWPGAIRALVAARGIMRADDTVQQIQIETISGREIARVYR